MVFILQLIIFLNFSNGCNYDSILENEKEAEKAFYEGDYLKSYIYYLDILKKKKSLKNIKSEDIAKTYFNLSTTCLLLFDYCNSLKFLELAENIYKRDTIFRDNLISIYILKGIIYYNKGDYKRAELILKYAINLLEKSYKKDNDYKIKKIKAYNAIASVYFEMKDYKSSFEFYKKAERIVKIIEDFEMLIAIKGNIASVLTKMNKIDLSNQYYEDAVDLILKFRELNFVHFMIFKNYLIFLIQSNNISKAKSMIEILLNKYQNNKNFYFDYFINIFYGNLYFNSSNKIDSSIYFFNKALNFYKSNFSNLIDINYLILLEDLEKLYYKKFLQTKDINTLKKSYNLNKEIIEIIEKLKIGFLTQESRLFLIENEYKIYINAIEVLMKLAEYTNNQKYYEEALNIAEKIKGSILYRMIKDNEAKIKGNIPDSILILENKYKRLITVYKELIYEEQKYNKPRNDLISKWEAKIIEYEDQYEKLLDFLEKNYPKYYSLKYNEKVFDIKYLQKLLKRNEVIFEYILSDSVIYTFCISKRDFFVKKKKIDSTFYKTFEKTHNLISKINFSFESYSFNELKYNLYYLYNILLKPFEKVINKKHIIIIPDDLLYDLPFEILLTQFNNNNNINNNFKDLSYLIKKNAVSYEYSCKLFIENRNRNFNKFRNLKVGLFAPEYNGKLLSRLRGIRQYYYRKDLLPIPGAIKEVEKISKIFKSDTFIGSNATEKTFKSLAGNYDILHLAMHTIIDNENPMYSKLVFSNSNDSTEDDLLNAYELYNMTLNAKMVVLSSCSSGKGMINKGEGIISISRSFYYAGSSSVLLTLWEIEDDIVGELMVNFYRYLRKGYSIHKALQFAKLKFINKQPPFFTNPFYWSPYVIYGNTCSLNFPLIYVLSIVFLIILCSILMFYILIRKYKK